MARRDIGSRRPEPASAPSAPARKGGSRRLDWSECLSLTVRDGIRDMRRVVAHFAACRQVKEGKGGPRRLSCSLGRQIDLGVWGPDQAKSGKEADVCSFFVREACRLQHDDTCDEFIDKGPGMVLLTERQRDNHTLQSEVVGKRLREKSPASVGGEKLRRVIMIPIFNNFALLITVGLTVFFRRQDKRT